MNMDDLIDAWAKLLRASNAQVQMLLLRAPYQYRHYTIPKRTGGERHIYHPTPNLKAVQRWLVGNSFVGLPVHEKVFSYRQGRNIGGHANEHLHSNFLLRLDFTDFFPSIDHEWLRQYLLKQVDAGNLEVDAGAVTDLVRLCCRYEEKNKSLALSIGAPSSPALSNAILFDSDVASANRCAELECVYTRYADDIYISARDKDRLTLAEKAVREIYAIFAPKLRFNEVKTINVSKKSRRVVTGVTLTSDRRLSVGRCLKRQIKTEVFLWTNEKLDPEKMSRLCGLISYVRDIEPAFYNSLCQKFGADAVEQLYRNAPRKDAWKDAPF